ncbi:MAG TPA: serine hydrolase [Croceibacterium sp.]|nr:serine hydrolase [Croceibacterium sp.]
MKIGIVTRIAASIALALAVATPGQARANTLEGAFDNALGTAVRAPTDFSARYDSPLAQRIAMVADGSRGRIGVAAIDLVTGEEVAVLGDQRFPMASTSKVAIAATFLEGVDQGRFSLDTRYPLLLPVSSRPFSSAIAPVRAGEMMTARQLMELMLTRSSNPATDALLKAVGGPTVVNDWTRRAGIANFTLTRDIATLVRDDGEFDPANHIDTRDSVTPYDMARLLAGLYQGKWLSPASRNLLIATMENCRTGVRRIPAQLPGGVVVAHKTGSLNNTSSDVGIITGPDGHAIALAIYVTGQGARGNREDRIAMIARELYEGYGENARQWATARYGSGGSSTAVAAN